ncbi:MAG: aldehyde dehydrogenase family protein [Geminicoccaceae bacterium]|nr:aldehyde dehydrogenase family protein [Geminicoccaceae bacterium]
MYGQHLIDGQWVDSENGETVEVRCPSDGATFARLAAGGPAEIDRAVAAARRAFEDGPWSVSTATARGRLLMRLGELAAARIGELAGIESRDTGKPLKQGRADIIAFARYCEYYGSAADKVHGDTIPFIEGHAAMTVREPHGVVGSIIPWNYPIQILGRVLGAAIAMGNTLVIKPAEDACLSIIEVGRLLDEAGFPPGVVNIVTGYGETAGAALAAHPGIDFVTFTGSPSVGTSVQTAAAANHVACTLELGGKSPQIVFDDADIEAALPVLVNAIIQNAGQTCSAGSRLLVQRSIQERLVGALAKRFAALRAGPHDREPDCGPLISRKQRDRVQAFIDRAVADGVGILAQGEVVDAPAGGYYVPPTLMGPVPADHAIAREEVFGPVLCVIPFDDEADALRIANATDYGLVAGIWTRDGARQMRLARKIRAGQVFINAYGAGGGVELPFGGYRKSGHGREKGFEGLLEFSRIKTIVTRYE